MCAAETDHSLDQKKYILTQRGLAVDADILSILETNQTHITPELAKLLSELISNLKPGLLDQLGVLSEKPVFPANAEQGGHWQYEQTMLKALLQSSEVIKQWLECDDRVIADLFFMILVSDIGKAGSVSASANEHSGIISRIYNHAIFYEKHVEWLKKCDPDKLPPELAPALASINKIPSTEGAPSDWDAVFSNGFFVPIPLELYLYVIKQVSIETAADDESAVNQANTLFTLNDAERSYLEEQGWNPATTRIRQFFTKSHIQFGNDFLQNDKYTTPDQQLLAPLALAHHFSQGILPDSITAADIIGHPVLLKICAFLEILDKTEATYHRFGDKSMQKAILYTTNECTNQLKTNYPDHPELISIYMETLDFMMRPQDGTNKTIFSGLD